MAPPRHARFEIRSGTIDRRTITLSYGLCGGPDPDIDLVETFELPEVDPPEVSDPAVRAALDDLLVACGVSYWKAACPAEIACPSVSLDATSAAFWSEVWTQGLGEFFYRNRLDPRGRIAFPASRHEAASEAVSRPISGPALLLVGGGKDSVVSREILRDGGVQVDLFSVGDPLWIRRSAAAMGDRHLVARRRLDPVLVELNARGAWNGHVPISAIVACVARLVALGGRHGAVVASNERSASFGNVEWHGLDVNHQWSKGLPFEAALDDRWVGAPRGPRYFSLLRPFSELWIAGRFARHPRYFDAVTSCNANFRLSGGEVARWCGRCAKCVFVWLVTSPHLDAHERDRVFGRDFGNDPENGDLLRELLGVSGHKPFECVGTPDEAAAAAWRLAEQGVLTGEAAVVARDAALTRASDPGALWAREMAPSPDHRVPPPYRDLLDVAVRAAR
jgi:hypothetical protein